MFSPDAIIDSVQGFKRSVTNQVITDPTLNTMAHAYIDAQTIFAKAVAQNAVALASSSVDSINYWFNPRKG